jgi:hypothetical protein
MRNRRSRLTLVGVLALAITVTVGLLSGGVADAAKKKKKKGAKSVTVSKTAPTAIPGKPSLDGNDTLVSIPLTVGKKAMGKVVGWDSLTVTTAFSSGTNQGLVDLGAKVTAPNGRTVFLDSPPPLTGIADVTTAGPTTETPNSPFSFCFPEATNPCPGGLSQDPEATVGPPFAGTVGNSELAKFGGVPARGTWTVKVFNESDVPGTLNSVSITMTLKNAPR